MLCLSWTMTNCERSECMFHISVEVTYNGIFPVPAWVCCCIVTAQTASCHTRMNARVLIRNTTYEMMVMMMMMMMMTMMIIGYFKCQDVYNIQ